jgi:hypothetical protein
MYRTWNNEPPKFAKADTLAEYRRAPKKRARATGSSREVLSRVSKTTPAVVMTEKATFTAMSRERLRAPSSGES